MKVICWFRSLSFSLSVLLLMCLNSFQILYEVAWQLRKPADGDRKYLFERERVNLVRKVYLSTSWNRWHHVWIEIMISFCGIFFKLFYFAPAGEASLDLDAPHPSFEGRRPSSARAGQGRRPGRRREAPGGSWSLCSGCLQLFRQGRAPTLTWRPVNWGLLAAFGHWSRHKCL